jgi:hypothetical protein
LVACSLAVSGVAPPVAGPDSGPLPPPHAAMASETAIKVRTVVFLLTIIGILQAILVFE